MFHTFEPNTIAYQIKDVDLWEQDAILEIANQRFYFQFSGSKIPDINDALEYIFRNQK